MFSDLIIRVQDYNSIVSQPQLMKQLRQLTLSKFSGLNKELDSFNHLSKERPVNAKVLLAYQDNKLVAWALLSKEKSAVKFAETWTHFEPHHGMLFEVFVHPSYRRQGIASELLKVARRKAGSSRLCVAPWDERSRSFYRKFSNYRAKWF